MAIISKSKRFIKSASCQKVIDGVWSGRVVYSASNSHAIIADVSLETFSIGAALFQTDRGICEQNYKRKPTHIYNPHLAPLLDHYRSVVSTGGLRRESSAEVHATPIFYLGSKSHASERYLVRG